MIPSWEERKNEKDNYYFEDYEIKPLHIIFFMSNYGFSFGNRRENIVVLFFFFLNKMSSLSQGWTKLLMQQSGLAGSLPSLYSFNISWTPLPHQVLMENMLEQLPDNQLAQIYLSNILKLYIKYAGEKFCSLRIYKLCIMLGLNS